MFGRVTVSEGYNIGLRLVWSLVQSGSLLLKSETIIGSAVKTKYKMVEAPVENN